MRLGARIVLLLVSCGVAAHADVIVLKSGRRITATRAVEEGDRVYYETLSGRLSFPRSAVERVERGASLESFASHGAAEAPVHAPRLNLDGVYDEVARAVVREGSIDREYLARLEREAAGGSPAAVERVAVGHHVVAQLELKRSELGRAMDHYRRGLTFAPDHLGLLLQLSYLHLRRSEFSSALDHLERARRLAPDDPDTAKLLGWAYRGTNRLGRAVEEWKRALRLRRDADVEAALDQAQRDQEEEKGYREGESRHFTLRYNGVSNPALARDVLRTLERHFTAVESELNYSPPDAIAVILYTGQAFADITRAPGWVGALNDGRIRLPVEGLTTVDAEMSRVLKHELTHSFIRQKTHEKCPTWLNEGVAQWLEGKTSEAYGAALAEALETRGPLPAEALEGSFLGLPGGSAEIAYAFSLALVEYLVRVHGPGDLQRLLDRITTEPSTEAALHSVYRLDYAELQQEAARYLRKTYVR